MIITRAPLRITFGGAPTDMPSYYEKYGGFCISAAIDKYVYIAINRSFQEEIILKYSEMENVKCVDEIRHPIFREAIRLMNFRTPQISISSIADVPSNGTGLGASGSFSVALIKSLHQYRNIAILPDKVAEIACDINISKLNKIQGKQDEYASALGGITCLTFNSDGTVEHLPLNISYEDMIELEDSLLLFYTGLGHNTEEILQDQDGKTRSGDVGMIENLHTTKQLGFAAKEMLESGRLSDFAALLNVQWEGKKLRSDSVPNAYLEEVHYSLLSHGALGNKLVGSGRGGFFLVYAGDKSKVRRYMKSMGLQEMRFRFDFEGCTRMV